MRTRILAAVAALSVTVSLTACSADTPADDSGVTDSGSWTVLTYSIADTDLEDFMMTDLEEFGQVGTQEGLNVVALVDRSSDYTDADVLGIPNWAGGKLIQINQGDAEILDDMGDVNTGDPAVLADFISRGISDYPADHYALVISDHGASWPGVGADESFDGDNLDLAELKQGITAGLSGAGIDKLDLLGFDACLMATYEVASTLAPVANRMVASQELEPGHGWDYSSFNEIADDGEATVDELASALIDGFKAQAVDEGDDAEITLSSIDLTRMGEVDAALKDFTDVLVEQAAGIGPTVGRTLAQTLGFGKNPDPDQDTHMVDLAIFTSQIGVDLLFASDAADELTRAINDVVLDRVDGQATQGATGLSIYFPPTEVYFDQAYTELPNTGGWMDFLTTYYGKGAEIEQGPVLADGAQIEFDADGVTITGTYDDVTAGNLASAFIRYGTVESDGSITFLGEEDADISDDGSASATGSFDLTYLTISDGEDTASGYLSLYLDDALEFATMDVPFTYSSPDGEQTGELLLSSVIDIEAGEVTSDTYYVFDPEAGTYGEFTPEADWIITPTVLNVLDDGTEQWLPTSEMGLYADLESLTYDFPSLESGTQLYLELVVIDFGGNTDRVSGIVTVP